jgi:uncharacterized protein (TIGR02284 family)
MTMTTTDRHLRDIRELLTDSRLGYADAARRADDERLKALLKQLGEARVSMVADLAKEMGDGLAPSPTGTFKGKLHRLWMVVRDIVSSTDNVNMLAECERGEAYLIGRYDEVLRDDGIGPSVRNILEAQREGLMSTFAEIKALDHTFSDLED